MVSYVNGIVNIWGNNFRENNVGVIDESLSTDFLT